MSEEKIKENILKTFENNKELYTKEIANIIGVTPATVSKYLAILYSEKKIKKREQRPYIYWSLAVK